ncbi:unnamed protein product [Rangifer tarandus platyrhynchus]|uniref:Uncharacterized protein n=3 Tax=Rangifer tarandus platyrhynchus TaxID=3082113 RepID=A0AC59Y5G8_RANTA|nr:unnamed protein product [Rangifer tarandus platyrhynchus]CAI9691929.1 unnamed protein product [Rangifer tarandus platyrhynchus]
MCTRRMDNHTTVSTFLLWGFSSFPDLQDLLFVMVFFSHVTILAANVSIMVAVKLNHSLHIPMYFFLCGLSFSETCTTVVVIPRMLVDLLSDSKSISIPECATQMFFFFGLSGNNCFIMAAMSYDRYTAIHNPLHYSILMTPKICFQLMMAAWLLGFLVSVCLLTLSFCGPNQIDHFFCDFSPLLKLSCSDVSTIEIIPSISSGSILVVTVFVIVLSYICILNTILKMRSTEGRHKAFSTCTSHLTAVTLYYGTIIFIYVMPKSSYSTEQNRVVSVFYTVLIPMLNPLIYSLRNRDVKEALRKVMARIYS